MRRLTDMLDFGPGLDIAARSSASISKLQAPENQDNMVLIDAHGRAVFLRDQVEHTMQLSGWPAGHVRLAVLDGMGGHGQGRQAAEAAAQGLLRMPACHHVDELSARLDALHAELQAAFRLPDDHDTLRRPGTTLTLLEIAPGQAPLLYHCGDSRLYEITPQAAQPLTIDHVPATAFAMLGLLGAQEWWQQVHAEHRAQISQAYILGNAFSNPQVLENALHPLDSRNLPPFLQHLADRRAVTLRPGACYLLATDGFWSCGRPQLWTARWPALLSGDGAAAPAARAALDALFAEYADHPPPDLHIDNLSAIVLRCSATDQSDKTPQRQTENVDETALPNALFPPHS